MTTFLTDWAAAETRSDIEALDAVLADDFVAVGPLGFTLSKQDWLDRHRGDLRYDGMTFEEITERHHGDVTMVVARQVSVGSYRGSPVPSTLRTTMVLVPGGTTWRLMGAHMSFVAGTPGAPSLPGRP